MDIYAILEIPPLSLLRIVMIDYFGWLIFAFIFLWLCAQVWLYWRRGLFAAKQKYVLLAIDVPRLNEQSPKAVENLLTYLAGAHAGANLIEKWWNGKYQLSFSLEVISVEGYTQFLIYSPTDFKNMVESAVYSQYPDAEVTEVPDYTHNAPKHFPDDEWDLWGSELIPVNDSMLPIRSYEEFIQVFGKPETHFRDPLSSLMDLMSSLKKSEQLWWQIIVVPRDQEWTAKAKQTEGKVFGDKIKPSGVWGLLQGLSDIGPQVISSLGGYEYKKAEVKKTEPKTFIQLKPREQKRIEGIQRKVSKLGFNCKMRMVYFAKKEVINKPKAVSGFFGFIKQLGDNDLNAFKPDSKYTMAKTEYFWQKSRLYRRQNRILYNYQNRDSWSGRLPYVLNVEELATLWHLPLTAVTKAPLLQRTSAKLMEAPMTLPIGEREIPGFEVEPIFEPGYEIEEKGERKKVKEEKKAPGFLQEEEKYVNPIEEQEKGAPPANLPFA